MALEPITRKEHFLARAAGNEKALELEPVTREEHFLQALIDAGGGGDGVVPGDPYPGVDLTQQFAAEIDEAGGDPWTWIHERTQTENFKGIHVGDYIPVVANGNTYKSRILGINTYKGYGDVAVGNHIDWMFEELWPTRKPINPANYNNGLIPVENVVSDGESVEYTLTKEMHEIASITLGGVALTDWTYSNTNFKITFEEAPAAGTMVVTGTGTEYPWLACDDYLYANSLAGHVPNGTTVNPPVKHVDYTQDGIYYHLPQELKDVIIQKRAYIAKRYSSASVLTSPNSAGWADIGYIWFPTEAEVYGQGVWANTAYEMMGSAIQYPYFVGNVHRMKKNTGERASWWLMSVPTGATSIWCYIPAAATANNTGVAAANISLPVCFRTA